jgi:gamma-glutamylcyclotransferase (GGCT)/AIG2-like uncharacterized protein YtfP
MIPITDSEAATRSGQTHYANAEPSATAENVVPGTVFEITEEELAKADQYEESAHYRRISVTLQSGEQAWVYVHFVGSRLGVLPPSTCEPAISQAEFPLNLAYWSITHG